MDITSSIDLNVFIKLDQNTQIFHFVTKSSSHGHQLNRFPQLMHLEENKDKALR